MRLAVHLFRLLTGTFRYAMSTRRYSILAVLVLGLILLAVTATAQTAAPLLLYPFA